MSYSVILWHKESILNKNICKCKSAKQTKKVRSCHDDEINSNLENAWICTFYSFSGLERLKQFPANRVII